MVKNYSLPPLHGLFFLISSNMYTLSHRQCSTYHCLCYFSCGALAGMRYSLMRDHSDDPSHHEHMLYHVAMYLSFIIINSVVLKYTTTDSPLITKTESGHVASLIKTTKLKTYIIHCNLWKSKEKILRLKMAKETESKWKHWLLCSCLIS